MASRAREVAEHRLEGCGLRGRRRAHRELDAADNRLIWANHHLEQPEASISPDVDRYFETGREMRQLREELRSHETAELFARYKTVDRIPHLQERLDALDTWWRFANGDKIDVPRLAEVVDILDNVDGDHGRYRVARRRRRPTLPRRRHPPPNSNPKPPASNRPASTSGCNDAAVLPPSPAVRRPDLDTQQVTRRVNRSA